MDLNLKDDPLENRLQSKFESVALWIVQCVSVIGFDRYKISLAAVQLDYSKLTVNDLTDQPDDVLRIVCAIPGWTIAQMIPTCDCKISRS